MQNDPTTRLEGRQKVSNAIERQVSQNQKSARKGV
eukprot:CAMPEP_0204165938 /NCGR_PEP_ID=MMETSP0361-20130328/38589_1 /ASSEMBLY_ACC=CAM_ASM_000343 /TAXON_ID=268821 /ORGANISM="Scrippsiella Hangoei, Strain SHTV-5" /LENGTH=34 /DNA_ID= /DNA_START= /DNA_END= /DNA_ORIENTATION=